VVARKSPARPANSPFAEKAARVAAERGHAVGDALLAYRADPRVDGAITFGMNAVIVEGIDRVMRRGMSAEARIRFD